MEIDEVLVERAADSIARTIDDLTERQRYILKILSSEYLTHGTLNINRIINTYIVSPTCSSFADRVRSILVKCDIQNYVKPTIGSWERRLYLLVQGYIHYQECPKDRPKNSLPTILSTEPIASVTSPPRVVPVVPPVPVSVPAPAPVTTAGTARPSTSKDWSSWPDSRTTIECWNRQSKSLVRQRLSGRNEYVRLYRSGHLTFQIKNTEKPADLPSLEELGIA